MRIEIIELKIEENVQEVMTLITSAALGMIKALSADNYGISLRIEIIATKEKVST